MMNILRSTFALVGGAMLIIGSLAQLSAQTKAVPLARAEASSGTTNCGASISDRVVPANQSAIRITASSNRNTNITIRGTGAILKQCNAALTCSIVWAYSKMSAGENAVEITFGDGACGEAGLTTWIDK